MKCFYRQTAFDRPTDIYIQNNTNKDLELFNVDLQSGELESRPPQVIKAGEKGYFRSDQTGLVGPSGFVTYKALIGDIKIYMSIYWSHPEGATSSVYYGYSSPFGAFYITPMNNLDKNQKPTTTQVKIKDLITHEESMQNVLVLNPTGHYESITYIVQYGLGHLVI